MQLTLKLHPRQTSAFLTDATEVLYGGAAGGGKSHLMRIALLSWCTAIPGLQCYLFRRTSDDLGKNHLEGPSGFRALLSEWTERGFVRFNEQKGHISFWNGAKIFLCHCQHEKDRFKYQGAEMHVLCIDELTHFTDTIYRYLRGRVRLGGLKLPEQYQGKFPRIICGSNPGGVGHNWVKATFIDNAPPMEMKRMPKEEGGMVRQYIPAKLSDNPTLAEADPDYVDRLEGLGNAALVKAMKDGDWDIVAGGALDDVWDRSRHVLRPFEIPSSWRIDRSFDWGSSHPFSVGWWAETDGTEAIMPDGSKRIWPRGTLFRIAEYYGWNGKPNEGCRMLAVEVARRILEIERSAFKGRAIQAGPADSSIFAAENGMSIGDDMARAGVRWEHADKSPGSRKAGLEALRKRLKAALPAHMEEPGLLVFDTCQHFIRTVPILPRDESKIDDVDSDAEDHCVHGDTIVDVPGGQRRIRDMVGTTGLVYSTNGTLQHYSDCRLTRKGANVVRVTFGDGRTVICTPDHKFLSENGAWVEAKDLTGVACADIIPHINLAEGICESQLSAGQYKSSMDGVSIHAGTITNQKGCGFTGPFTSITTGQSRQDSASTTLIQTAQTISQKTLNCLKRVITNPCTQTKQITPTGLTLCTQVQRSGTEAMKAGRGIVSNTKRLAALHWQNVRSTFARIAERLLSAINGKANIAQTIANQRPGASLALTLWSAFALCVEMCFRGTNTTRKRRAQEVAAVSLPRATVVSVEPFGNADVYCLNVDSTRAFSVCGGLIIHNCYDDTRYRVLAPKRVVTSSQSSAGW